MNGTGPIRDVYDAVADPTRRKLLRLLADAEELPLNELTVHFDFKPVVGHKFQFRTEPTEWWNGIIDCDVLEVDEPLKLSYTWVSGGISTTVTWTLKHADGTTHMHLEQTGFESEDHAFNGAKYGWVKMGGELEKVLAEL